MLKKIKKSTVLRYIVVGGLSYLIELSVLITLYKILHLSAEASTAIAFWCGLAASFILQKFIAFRDYEKTVKRLGRQMVIYGVLVAVNYIFTLGVVAFFPSKLIIFSRTLALVITTSWNYIIYKKIFVHGQESNSQNIKDSVARNLVPKINRRTVIFSMLATLPIIIFFYQYLASGSRVLIGDFDYTSQIYEAFRLSVLHYHQIPLWNPWISGGVPLFANPQFGLFSIQSLFVLIFGTVIGLKLAYVLYALAGFSGMYVLCRKMIGSPVVRSLLISYVWIFCGFFAGHNISHYTFTSFFFMPWLIYFIAIRSRPKSWLWFGLLESLIILSSLHYAFLIMTLSAVIYFIISLFEKGSQKKAIIKFSLSRSDIAFAYKAILVILIVAGYRVITTYYFIAHNQRPTAILHDPSTPLSVLFKAVFLPIGTFLSFPKTQWGWGEYSMYIGLGAGLAMTVVILSTCRSLIHKKRINLNNSSFIVAVLIVGVIAFGFAIGDFARFSPFHVLHRLPGFSQTRVSSRWLIITTFSLLLLLAAWPRNKRTINILLALSVIELFFSFGPPRVNGSNETSLPSPRFYYNFRQYDNHRKHLDAALVPMHSYYYTTAQNIGQIYGDDAIIDTLDGVLNTSKCGYNDTPSCDFILSHNAKLTYWSPNKITLVRTAPGQIELNMNVDAGWRVNNTYPFAAIRVLDPSIRFVLTQKVPTYNLDYSPKFSPGWIKWRLEKS